MSVECPRCKGTNVNRFNVRRYDYTMPINKCVRCGFLFIEDIDLVKLGAKDAKRLFIEYLRNLGGGNGRTRDTT